MQKLACVLLVDDDEITNFIHESLIQEMKLTEDIICTNSGMDALELLSQMSVPPDGQKGLILLDLNMPGMNGFDFLEAFDGLEPERKEAYRIIIMTTSQNPRDIEEVKKMDVLAYLNKPFNQKKLMQVLEQHFQ